MHSQRDILLCLFIVFYQYHNALHCSKRSICACFVRLDLHVNPSVRRVHECIALYVVYRYMTLCNSSGRMLYVVYGCMTLCNSSGRMLRVAYGYITWCYEAAGVRLNT